MRHSETCGSIERRRSIGRSDEDDRHVLAESEAGGGGAEDGFTEDGFACHGCVCGGFICLGRLGHGVLARAACGARAHDHGGQDVAGIADRYDAAGARHRGSVGLRVVEEGPAVPFDAQRRVEVSGDLTGSTEGDLLHD
ncbi:MAG: hypothetical protein AAGG08_21035, partial [Actinomycetota bacterium]